MDVTQIDPNNSETATHQAQCPIVCFKASTVFQGMGVIASRTLLPSADVEGQRRQRTYCPTTFNTADSYDTPSAYSDQLARHGSRSLLAHECVIPLICHMRNKKQKHPTCACAHAPSAVAIGIVIPIISYYQPKFQRKIKLEDMWRLRDQGNLIGVLNDSLRKKKTHFEEVPPVKDDNEIFMYISGKKLPYKFCPETDAEELVYVSDQELSLIESWYKPSWLKAQRSSSDTAQGNASGYAQGSGSGYAQGWKGSSNRAASAPAKAKEVDRNADPVETPLDWYELTPANLDEAYLFPQTKTEKCPTNKNTRKHSNEENAQYMLWIQKLIPSVNKKDEWVCCPYCDVKNHLRWTLVHLEKHGTQHAQHACTLCIGKHPSFLCPLAKCNRGAGKPNWPQQEKKQVKDQNRGPNYDQTPQTTSTRISNAAHGYLWPTRSTTSTASRRSPVVCSNSSYASGTADQLTSIFWFCSIMLNGTQQADATASDDVLLMDAYAHAAPSRRTCANSWSICIR